MNFVFKAALRQDGTLIKARKKMKNGALVMEIALLLKNNQVTTAF